MVCNDHTAAEDLGLADNPESLAILGEILTNTSSVVGGSAQFYCEVIGTQALGETLRFAKVRECISQMMPLNLWVKRTAQLNIQKLNWVIFTATYVIQKLNVNRFYCCV